MTEFDEESPKPQIPPRESDEIPFANADWEEVPFDQLRTTILKPFQVISGIPSISACKLVEEQVCRSLLVPFLDDPTVRTVDALMSGESRIMEDSIVDHIRPAKFNGSFVNARAIILPFDAARAVESRPGFAGRLQSGELTDSTPGLRVIYVGDLRSSRTGPLGTLLREVAYFQDRPIPKQITHRSRNFLHRSVRSSVRVSEVYQVVAANVEDSKTVAARVARYALRHMYSAGAPGLGRKR